MAKPTVTRDALGDDYHAVLFYNADTDAYEPLQTIETNGNVGIVAIAPGHVSTKNSVAFSPAGEATWTGEAEDVTNFGVISVNIRASQNSATDGLVIEQSSNGTNWDHSDAFTIPANTGKVFSFQAAAKYYRVKYTNGETGATIRLQTVLKPYYVKPSSHRIKDTISGEDDAELVKAVITGADPGGDFINFEATAGGNFKTSIEEYDNSLDGNPLPVKNTMLEIGKGNVTGHSYVQKFGEATNIDSADPFVDVWDGTSHGSGIKTYTFSTTADIDSISSSDNTDTQDIELQGLDTNWDLTVQTITLTGQTRKALDTPLIRVFRMKNMGSTNNAGDIFCYVNGAITAGVPDVPADIRAIIQIGHNQTLMAIYAIPNGKTGYVCRRWASILAKVTGYSTVRSHARPFGGVFQLKYSSTLATTGTSSIQDNFTVPLKMPAKTDVKICADASSNDMGVSAGFDIILVDD